MPWRKAGRWSVVVVAVLLVVGAVAGPPVAAQPVHVADLGVDLLRSYDGDVVVRVTNDGPSTAVGRATVQLSDGLVALQLPFGCGAAEDEVVAAGAASAVGGRIVCETPPLQVTDRTSFPLALAQVVRGTEQVEARVASEALDLVPTDDVDATALRLLPSPRPTTDVITAAIEVSRLRFPDPVPTARHVVLARADLFPDALAGSALLGEGPLLLVPGDGLPPAVAEEARRVVGATGLVYLLGGPQALGEPVADALRAQGADVRRLAGDDRIQTALAIAEEVVARRGPTAVDPIGVAVARAAGEGTAAWADAVAAGGWAAATGSPVLLSPPDGLPADVATWIVRHAPAQVTLLGGEAALGPAVAQALPAASRVAGADRAATAVAVAEQLGPGPREGRAHHLVNGYVPDGWAYGLLAAGLAADEGAPVLYVDRTDAAEATRTAVTTCRDQPVALAVVGAVGHVDPALRHDLDQLDAGDTC